MRNNTDPDTPEYMVGKFNEPLRQVDRAAWETMLRITTNGYGRVLIMDDTGRVYVEFEDSHDNWHAAARWIAVTLRGIPD